MKPDYKAITKAEHGERSWRRPRGYSFASGDSVASLVLQELPKAAAHLPLAFARREDQILPIAVLGVEAGQNLFVDPTGRWLAGYVPAAYRGYPFVLAAARDQQGVLCVDEASGLVENHTDGLPFFNGDEAGEEVRAIMGFLAKVATNHEQTLEAARALAEEELLVPWPARVELSDENRTLAGLMRVDEEKLASLDGGRLQALLRAGALPMAYCQLISTQHLSQLERLARQRVAEDSALGPEAVDIEGLFGDEDEVLRFDFD